MARKNPVGKLTETALSTLKDPKAAAGKVVDQAKGTVALGRMVADSAGAAVGKAAGAAAGKVTGRGSRKGGTTAGGPSGAPARPTGLRAVPDVNEPAHTQPPGSAREQEATLTPTEAPAESSVRTAATPAASTTTKAAPSTPPAKKAPAKKAPAKKAAPVKKAPAKKAAPVKKEIGRAHV